MREALLDLLASAPRARVAVVGDLVLDRYLYGRPIRLSREAPIVVLAEEGEEGVPGGAGNTAANVAGLGAKVEVLGILGDDADGRALRTELRRRGIGEEGVQEARGGYTTPRKTRILAGDRHARRNQMLRLEREPAGPPAPEVLERLAARVRRLEGAVGAVLVSDYGYGTTAGPVLEALHAIAGRVPLVVDSRRRLLEFRGAAVLTPNEQEAFDCAGEGVEDAAVAARTLRERTGAARVLVTRGNRGMVVVDAGGEHAIEPIGPPYAVDGTGAGDTVSGTIGLGVALAAEFGLAARLAACAAGVVVMKPGTAPIAAAELRDAIRRWV